MAQGRVMGGVSVPKRKPSVNGDKILFLDIDGVLNRRIDFIEQYEKNGTNVIGRPCLTLLQRILQETRCKIVLSSTWRLFDWESDLEYHGFPTSKVVGVTPIIHTGDMETRRGREIHQYIVENYPHAEAPYDTRLLKSFCIVDDNNDMLPYQQDMFVQTSTDNGLTPVETKKIIEILNGK